MRRAFDGTYPITRNFGIYDPAYSSYPNSLHPGTDYGLPFRTPLLAGMTGTLTSIDRDRTLKTGRGKEIVITNGMKTRKYCHLDEIVVRSGSVTEGQLVGYSGTTGYSSGPHLHDELLINGVYVPLEANLKGDDMATPRTIDLAFKGMTGRNPTQEELNNPDYANDANLLVETVYNAGADFRNQANKADELTRIISIKDNEIARLNALVGESTKWQTLRTLLRELLGIK